MRSTPPAAPQAGDADDAVSGGEKFVPLSPEIDARLRDRFRPEVEALEDLIGRDLSAWKKNPRGDSSAMAADRA